MAVTDPQAVKHLIQAFEIEHGLIHPEFFSTHDGNLHFGEVAYRLPGGNAFELIGRTYGFNAYQAHVLSSDPKATEEEIQAFFPREIVDAKGLPGVFWSIPSSV